MIGNVVWYVVVSMLCASGVSGAAPVLTGYVKPATVALNETTVLSIELPPAATGRNTTVDDSFLQAFTVVSRGAKEHYMYTNGAFSRTYIKQFTLQPKKKGTIIIPETTIMIAGTPHKTVPISVTVTDPKPQQPRSRPTDPFQALFNSPAHLERPEMQLEATLNKQQIYVGEEVVYRVALYRRFSSFNTLSYSEPRFAARSEPLQVNQEVQVVRRQGRNYYQQVLYARALYPFEPGVLTLEPAQVEVDFGAFYRPQSVDSNTVEVTVLPLPEEGKPANFTGLVGAYTLTIPTPNVTALVHKPIAVRVRVNGGGGVKQLNALTVSHNASFTLYQSNVNDQLLYADRVQGWREFEYIVVPEQAGEYVFPRFSLTSFVPDTQAYHTVYTPTFAVTVLGETATAPLLDQAPVDAAITTDQYIRFIKDIDYTKTARSVWMHPLILCLYGCCLGLAGVVMWPVVRHSNLFSRVITWVEPTLYQRSLRQLTQLANNTKGSQEDSVQLQHILMSYLTCVVAQDKTIHTQGALLDALKKKSVCATSLARIERVFLNSAMIAYGSQSPSVEAVKALCHDAIGVLKETKE